MTWYTGLQQEEEANRGRPQEQCNTFDTLCVKCPPELVACSLLAGFASLMSVAGYLFVTDTSDHFYNRAYINEHLTFDTCLAGDTCRHDAPEYVYNYGYGPDAITPAHFSGNDGCCFNPALHDPRIATQHQCEIKLPNGNWVFNPDGIADCNTAQLNAIAQQTNHTTGFTYADARMATTTGIVVVSALVLFLLIYIACSFWPDVKRNRATRDLKLQGEAGRRLGDRLLAHTQEGADSAPASAAGLSGSPHTVTASRSSYVPPYLPPGMVPPTNGRDGEPAGIEMTVVGRGGAASTQ